MGQLSALFYKNWLLYKRGIVGNIIEMAVPIFFVLFIVLTRNLDKAVDYAQQDFLTNASYVRTINSVTSSSAYLKYFFCYVDIAMEKWWDWHHPETHWSTS
jgi:hypothetical protein